MTFALLLIYSDVDKSISTAPDQSSQYLMENVESGR